MTLTLALTLLFGTLVKATVSPNSLSFNALNFNALTFNALNFNSLTYNALASNALIGNALTSNSLTNNALASNAIIGNALASNALSGNALLSNSLPNNSITGNALTSNSTTMNALPSVTLEGFTLQSIKVRMEDPNNTLQEILPFLIHCTLPPWKSFTAPNSTESISGVFGFAPNIDQIPLEPDQAKMVSACLISLVNYYGHHVQVSGRNMPYAAAVPSEISQWSVYEGAFFGDVWAGLKFACRGDPMTTAMEASSDRSWRRCTDPGISCGFTIVGNCADACDEFTPGYGYSTCRGADEYYPAMNIFLESNLAVLASEQSSDDDPSDPSAGTF